MVALKIRDKRNIQNKKSGNGIKMEIRILVLFLGLFVICIIGYFVFHDHSIRFVFAHLGGLGIIGLLGCLTGIIAKMKGYSYWQAFLFGLIIPIFFGVLAVLLFEPSSCGGSTSLGVALLILIIYTIIKRRKIKEQTES